jgi:hypothetical protein
MCATTLSETTFSLMALDLMTFNIMVKKSLDCNHAMSQYIESNFTDLGYGECLLAEWHNTKCYFTV